MSLMKNVTIGYLFTGDLSKDEKIFLEEAKKKNVELVLLNLSRDSDEKRIEELIKSFDLVYNATAEDYVIEIVKTIEGMGKKVVDSSKAYYYIEDKWLFFLKCKENNIPTPETILLSENETIAKKELKEFGRWPVVLKRVVGTMGEYVEKADNISEAIGVINKFWKKGGKNFPVVAQEFIHSPSYRVTVIDGEIVQTALKENKGWKATGVYAKKFKKFEVDEKLKKIIDKVVRISGIKICGIDFFKKDGEWIVLEINSEPGFDFFEGERRKLIGKTLNYLVKVARQ